MALSGSADGSYSCGYAPQLSAKESQKTDEADDGGGGDHMVKVSSSRMKQLQSQASLANIIAAAQKGDVVSLESLFYEGANMEIADWDGRTALHLAAAEGNASCVKFLLENCANVNPKDRWGHTPKDEAEKHKHLGIVDLLQEAEAKIQEGNIQDVSADRQKAREIGELLHVAQRGNIAAIMALKEKGTDLEESDYDERTALHVAAADGRLEAVIYLVEVCQVNPDPKDKWGKTPLAEARDFGHTAVASFLKAVVHSNSSASDDDGSPERQKVHETGLLLQYAADGKLEKLKGLRDEGTDMNQADYDKRTALHVAAAEGRKECVEFLLNECGVKSNPRDRWGGTPEQEARDFHHTAVVDLFKRV